MLKTLMNVFSKTPANEAEEQRALIAFRLLRQEAIQSRLALGVEQRAAIERYVAEARKVLKADAPSSEASSEPGPPRRGHELLRRTAVEVMHSVERDSILTPQQMESLRQLCYKRLGVQAFLDANMHAALQLTPEQIAAVQNLVRDLPAGGRRTEGESAESREARRTTRRDALDAILGKLTEPQRTKWAELTGAPARRRGRGIARRREGGRPVRRGGGPNRGHSPARVVRPIDRREADELGEG